MRRLLLFLLALLLLSGCTSVGTSSEDVSGGADFGGDTGETAPEPGRAPGESVGLDLLPEDVIRTGDVQLSVPDVAASRLEVRSAAAARSARLESEEFGSSAGGEVDSAVLVLRVPSDRFDLLVSDLSDLGRVVSVSTSAVDVSEEVVDTEARIGSLEASISRLEEFLGETGDVADLVEVESAITSRTAELESLQARLRFLEDRVALSTLSVFLYSSGTPLEEDESGFFAGLSSGWDAFVSFLVGALTLLGLVLPFLLLGATGLLTWWLLRRRRRGRTARSG